jgi:SAM-dependent methyltransferase
VRKTPILSYLCHELANVWSKYVHNDARGWEAMYAWEYAAKLESSDQRARHWIVAGMIAEVPVRRPRILDVGCGCGTTYGALRARDVEYRGIDLSATAVAAARAAFAGDQGCTFAVADFERAVEEPLYDAVVLNEVLYYFPLSSIPAIAAKAHRLVAHPGGLLIVSMSDNPKARFVWNACRGLPRPVHAVSLGARAWSSRWTVRAFPRGPEACSLAGSGRAGLTVS